MSGAARATARARAPRRMAAQRVALAGALALAAGAACGGSEPSPEARVRAALAAAEAAAEARDLGALMAHVSSAYADARGNDVRDVRRLLAGHLLANRSIHLLVRVDAVALPAPDRARVGAWVAMAGRPLPERPDADALRALRADVLRFELELVLEDGDWRVVAADWRRVAPVELL